MNKAKYILLKEIRKLHNKIFQKKREIEKLEKEINELEKEINEIN